MIHKKIYYIVTLLATLFLIGCSEEGAGSMTPDGKYRVRVATEMEQSVVVTSRAADGYDDMSDVKDDYQNWVLDVKAKKSGKEADGGTASFSESAWESDLSLAAGTYKLVAYMPKNVNASEVIFVNNEETGDDELVFSEMKPFSSRDVLYSVGAVKGVNADIVSGSYLIEVGPDTRAKFRMNHLMARMTINFQLASEGYNALRRIEITKVTVGSTIEGSDKYKVVLNYGPDGKNMNSKPTLTCSASGNKVASEELTYKKTVIGTTETEEKSINIESGNAFILSSNIKQYNDPIYLLPQAANSSNQISMKITYNVYDKKSESDTEWVMTRKDATATNSHLALAKNANGSSKAIEAAHAYTLNVKVIPSYLYVLADRDQSSSIVLN